MNIRFTPLSLSTSSPPEQKCKINDIVAYLTKELWVQIASFFFISPHSLGSRIYC